MTGFRVAVGGMQEVWSVKPDLSCFGKSIANGLPLSVLCGKGEYMRRLIHEAQKRAAREDLELKLISGLESGEAIEITPEYWEQKRRELVERHARKKS